MKIKSEIFVLLIILCILFGISAVSASEIQIGDIGGADDYQSGIGLNQDLQSEISDGADFNLNTLTDDEKLNSSNREEVSSVDEGTFDDFHNDLKNSNGTFNLKRDYIYSTSDNYSSSNIYTENLIINGNNHVIDGININYGLRFYMSEGKNLIKSNITINNLTFKNFMSAALTFDMFNVTLNNVSIINCSSDAVGSISMSKDSELHFNNSKVYSRFSTNFILGEGCKMIISNSNFTGEGCYGSCISFNRGQLIVDNCIFENFSADHGSIINFRGDHLTLKNSKFLNSYANLTGGAIIAKYFPVAKKINGSNVFIPSDTMLIENCLFSNRSSVSNGGVMYIDFDSGSERVPQSLNIACSNFTDCKSKMGGAIVILGGSLNIEASKFIRNHADFEGGAVYSSWTDVNISDSIFENNTANHNAGVLFFDKGRLTINSSSFTGNNALKESDTSSNAIYAYDVNAYIANSIFDNGGVGVYADFAGSSKLENIEKKQ